MKRLIPFACCLIIPLMFASCGDDEGGINTDLFGDWTKVRTVLRECANANDNNSQTEVCDSETCETLTLTDDLRYELTILTRGQAAVEQGQVQISETQIRLLPDNSTSSSTYDYSVAGSSLTLSNVTVICIEDFVYNK